MIDTERRSMDFWDWFCDNILGEWWYDGTGLLVVMLLLGSVPYVLFEIGYAIDAKNLDENGLLETVDNKASTIEEIKVPAIVAQARPRPIEPKRPLLATQVDSESGRVTIELSDGMKAVFIVALIVCCLVLIAGYWTAVHLIRKEKANGRGETPKKV